jgi:uncharacterized membrane protein YGL010W
MSIQQPQKALGPKLSWHVEKYGASHRMPGNMRLHYVGIPLIALGWLGLLAKVAVPDFDAPAWRTPNLGMALLVATAYWYLWCNWRIGLLMTAVGVAGYFIGCSLSAWVLGGMFAAGAALHNIGHYAFEGKPPALLTRPIAIIEAPIWLLAIMLGYSPANADRESGSKTDTA